MAHRTLLGWDILPESLAYASLALRAGNTVPPTTTLPFPRIEIKTRASKHRSHFDQSDHRYLHKRTFDRSGKGEEEEEEEGRKRGEGGYQSEKGAESTHRSLTKKKEH